MVRYSPKKLGIILAVAIPAGLILLITGIFIVKKTCCSAKTEKLTTDETASISAAANMDDIPTNADPTSAEPNQLKDFNEIGEKTDESSDKKSEVTTDETIKPLENQKTAKQNNATQNIKKKSSKNARVSSSNEAHSDAADLDANSDENSDANKTTNTAISLSVGQNVVIDPNIITTQATITTTKTMPPKSILTTNNTSHVQKPIDAIIPNDHNSENLPSTNEQLENSNKEPLDETSKNSQETSNDKENHSNLKRTDSMKDGVTTGVVWHSTRSRGRGTSVNNTKDEKPADSAESNEPNNRSITNELIKIKSSKTRGSIFDLFNATKEGQKVNKPELNLADPTNIFSQTQNSLIKYFNTIKKNPNISKSIFLNYISRNIIIIKDIFEYLTTFIEISKTETKLKDSVIATSDDQNQSPVMSSEEKQLCQENLRTLESSLKKKLKKLFVWFSNEQKNKFIITNPKKPQDVSVVQWDDKKCQLRKAQMEFQSIIDPYPTSSIVDFKLMHEYLTDVQTYMEQIFTED